ncbi:MAG: hypothetical protein GY834_02260 [Bacteroidetes bacterium]|nr:hypothetical protein [Bacteroidota bacterium]
MSWIEEAKNAAVGSGTFLKVFNALKYIISFDEIFGEKQNIEVLKDPYKAGGKKQKKYWFEVRLHEVGIANKKLVEMALLDNDTGEIDPKKQKKLDDCLTQTVDQLYTLEIAVSHRKALGAYLAENNMDDEDLPANGVKIKMVRTGASAKTKYLFSKPADKVTK